MKGDSMREKLARFMAGRNGPDQLSRALTALLLAVLILSMFAEARLSRILMALFMLGVIYLYFRIFSRNVSRRREENAAYMQRTASIRAWFRSLGERWRQRRDYKFFRCPMCRTLLRVPKGKGKIKIVCRKCGNSFIRNT